MAYKFTSFTHSRDRFIHMMMHTQSVVEICYQNMGVMRHGLAPPDVETWTKIACQQSAKVRYKFCAALFKKYCLKKFQPGGPQKFNVEILNVLNLVGPATCSFGTCVVARPTTLEGVAKCNLFWQVSSTGRLFTVSV